jgi:prevent-host-death family protein
MNSTFSVPISKLRQNTADIVSQVVNGGMSAVIMQRSQPKVVIADYEYFNSLEETVMDVFDGIDAEKRKKEPMVLLSDYAKKRWGKASL